MSDIRADEVVVTVEWGHLVLHGGPAVARAVARGAVVRAGIPMAQAAPRSDGVWVARSREPVSSMRAVDVAMHALSAAKVSRRLVAGVLSPGPGGAAQPASGTGRDLRTLMAMKLHAADTELALLHWDLEVARQGAYCVGRPSSTTIGGEVLVVGLVDLAESAEDDLAA